ncbi:MAG: peptide deformylase [Desulfobacterales bacterium]|jgi:peptide deformylase|nr:peptide deformylase [Desulfobacterales bacterium]
MKTETPDPAESTVLLPAAAPGTRLRILTYPEKILLNPTEPLVNIDGRVQQMIDSMAEAMYAAPGVGLAANQVGWGKSLLIYDLGAREGERELRVLINPKILESEGQVVSENEGCLSIPDYRADVKRAERILIEGVDREGNPVRLEAEDFHAIVLQHEMDHLNGKLFIDRISSLKRELYKRRVRKTMRDKEDDA